MKIIYISKYVVLPDFGAPTRQYFISKSLAKKIENEVLLIGSRSTLGNIPKFKGLFQKQQEERLSIVTLNGPRINLGFNFKRLWSWIIFELNLLRFRKYIRNFKPEVMIVSSLSILTFLSGVFFKRWLKIPLVIEIRDIYPLTLQEIGGYSRFNPVIIFLSWVEKFGYKNADLIVSTLPNASEHISEVIKKPFEFLWLPMGVDKDYYNNDENASYLMHPKKEIHDFIIGYSGTIGRANALDTIFEVAEELSKSHPYIKFEFIGDGPLKEFYVEKYKDSKNVTFFPSVPKKDLPIALRNSDILINTWLNKPIYRFGISPNKWMDYMYAAKPILVAFSGFKCIIDEAQCGIFVPAEDTVKLKEAIIKLYDMNEIELHTMGVNGKNYVINNLSYDVISKNLTDKLNEILNKRLINFRG